MAIKSDETVGTPASVETEHPSAEYIRSLYLQCFTWNQRRSGGEPEQRKIRIKRVLPDGTEISSIERSLISHDRRERRIELPNLKVAFGKTSKLMVEFTQCRNSERQAIYLGYDIVKEPE